MGSLNFAVRYSSIVSKWCDLLSRTRVCDCEQLRQKSISHSIQCFTASPCSQPLHFPFSSDFSNSSIILLTNRLSARSETSQPGTSCERRHIGQVIEPFFSASLCRQGLQKLCRRFILVKYEPAVKNCGPIRDMLVDF